MARCLLYVLYKRKQEVSMPQSNNAVKVKISKSNDENILSLYLKEINNIPLLTREEEETYARAAAQGDQRAKDKMVQANLRFVVNVAKKYQNQGLPLADLISEGNIGLLNAIERFDVEKGYHFISYAVWWIRQAILKAICEKSRMIRLPLNRANELVQIEKARKEIQWDSNSEPEVEAIAKQLDMDPDHVAELINISRDLVSLDTPIYDEKDSSLLSDFIEDRGYKSPDDAAIDTSLQEDINILLKTLSEKEADILEYRFGLNGKRPMSLKEIGNRYKLTKERIRQIEKKALKRLQHPSRSMYLSSYLA
jgi:RNA polymerase primary sigma factor